MDIPLKYRSEFKARIAELTKSRVNFFCLLSMGLYFFSSALSFLMAPPEFRPKELILWALMLVGCGAIMTLNRYTKTLERARLNAYLFTAVILVILTSCNIIYYDSEYLYVSTISFLYVFFLVCLAIPWPPSDILPIALMHVAAFWVLASYIGHFRSLGPGAKFSPQHIIDTAIFLLMGFLLVYSVRKRDTEREIQNFILLKEIDGKNMQMQRELELATRIHKTLIPKSLSTDKVDIAVTYMPMYYVGGDYAKFRMIGPDRLIFIICDVTGHGVSAALFVNRLHTEFERLAASGIEPGRLLASLDEFIKKAFDGINMYMSAFCGLLDFSTGKLIYSNHGHPAQYIYRVKDSDITHLRSQASLLGLPFDESGIYQHDIGFSRGDKLLLFTDGVIETKNAGGDHYGEERLEKFIKDNSRLYADLFNKRLTEELNSFHSGSFEDDIFMLSIDVK
jgi:hypothetical protein